MADTYESQLAALIFVSVCTLVTILCVFPELLPF